VLRLDLAVRRGDFRLEVDLTIAARVCAVAGPSGSGKTSLLEAVAGLARPERGRIELDGCLLFDSATRVDLPPERRQLGYVFQDGALFPHLSVAGNLRYGLRRRRGPGPAWEEVVEVLGLGALLERRVTSLSGGERQRVGLGRALLAAPRLLLLDEPLASLDAELKRRILPFLARCVETFGVPVLYVSHSARELLTLADEAVLLAGGSVVAAGPPAALFAPEGPGAGLALY
jgi:molybdate transport system ATP-binding protein